MSKHVDDEVRTIIDSCYYEVIRLLTEHRKELDDLKTILVEQEIIDGGVVYDIIKK